VESRDLEAAILTDIYTILSTTAFPRRFSCDGDGDPEMWRVACVNEDTAETSVAQSFWI
jgi:hypothetical protein